MAFFKTSRVESNEVVKAEDISYNFDSQVSNFSVLLQGLVDNKHDFVVGGKVSVLSGMNLSIEPILGCCKETGICFVSTEKITEGIAVSTGESKDRIDIVQIKAIEEDYDEQQRSFIDFETKIETVQNVFTKKRVILQVEVKKGVAGSVVAPNTDTGFVKLAEIYVPANTLTIDEWGIYNITANYNGEDNTDWTNEKDRTYDFQYLSDLNKEFQSEHNKDGSHKNGVIGSDELDYGVGEKQINNAILPIGKNIKIDNTNYSAATQTATFLENLAQKISTIFSDYYNKGGKYNFNGELKISDLFSNNALTKPLRIKSDGKGFAYFYIGNKLIFTITESGLFQMPSGYNATATNEVVTKATTDAIITQLGTINTKIGEIEALITSNQEFVNSVFNRYTFSDKVITVATTANISLSKTQTIDGIALSVGNVVLVKNQTTTKQNGIYEVQTGAWNRLSGFTEFSSIKNKFFTITKGTANKGKVFFSPQEVCTLGTDNLIFKESFYKNLETKYTVPIRDSNGNIKTGTPSATNDAAPKNYVDDMGTSAKNLDNATSVLSVNKGGTGKTTAKDACNTFLNALDVGDATPKDNDYYISQFVNGGTTTTTYHRRPMSELWAYIQGKISSLLGLTAESYTGTAKTISDTLPITKGGTGETTAKGAQYNLLNNMNEETDAMSDSTLVSCTYTNPSSSNGAIYKRKASNFWTYIKSKISSDLGISEKSSYIKGLSISGKTITYTKGDNTTGTLTTQDTTYSVATTSANGLMSASDKSKLDGIAAGANAYTHPTTSGNKHIPSGGDTWNVLGFSESGTAKWTANIDRTFTCGNFSTAAEKTLTLPNFELTKGTTIRVCFTNGNNVASPTLNVNNTGAKEIRVLKNGNKSPLEEQYGSETSGAYKWDANTVLELLYDGTYWVAVGNPVIKYNCTGYKNSNPSTGEKLPTSTLIYLDGFKKVHGDIGYVKLTANQSTDITVNYDTSFYHSVNVPNVSMCAYSKSENVTWIPYSHGLSGFKIYVQNKGSNDAYPYFRWDIQGI